MDKPKKGNTITIKINGDAKSYQEELKKNEPQAVTPIPIIKKTEPATPESEDAFSESAAAQESAEESFDWIIPESSDNDLEEFQFKNMPLSKNSGHIASFSPKKKKGPSSIVPVFVSAVFAILIGTAIGFFMLKLVIIDPGKKAAADPNSVATMGGIDKSPNSAKTTSAAMEQMTTYIVQGGIYSSPDGAKETVKQLTADGIPSQFIQLNGKTYIFLGVADSIEAAKSLSDQYKQNGAKDAFAKPLLVDGKKISHLSADEKSLTESLPAIYKVLSNAASAALTGDSSAGDSTKALADAEKKLAVSNLKNDKIKKLHSELSSAAEKINAYQKTKDTNSLTDAEQHLLNYLSLYYSL